MVRRSVVIKGGVVALACGAIGTGVAFAANSGTTSQSPPNQQSGPKHPHGNSPHGARGPLARMVHGQAVVPGPNGQFQTVTFDRGIVQSVDANKHQLTLKEGTQDATFQVVTITVPSDAKIRNNGNSAQLSDIKQGEMAGVIQAPGHNAVMARNAPAPKSG